MRYANVIVALYDPQDGKELLLGEDGPAGDREAAATQPCGGDQHSQMGEHGAESAPEEQPGKVNLHWPPGKSAASVPTKTRSKKAPQPDELWHTPEREAWVTIGGWHYPVKSPEFRDWLAGQLYTRNGEAASERKLDEWTNIYGADGRFVGPEHRVHLRTARAEGAIWLDLADAEGRAVRIDKEGWEVVPPSEVPVKFVRPPNMKALPEPLRDEADTSLLRDLLNLPDGDTFRLLLTWVSFAILPAQPYPVIAVSGAAGAAKSFFAEFVRNIIDPSEVPLVGVPRGQDLVAYAKNNHVLCFDNLSSVSVSR